MFEKVLSFVCCCFPALISVTAPSSTSSIKHKHHTPHKKKAPFIISCPSSTPCYLSPIIIPCTPTTANSSQHPLCEDSTMTSTDDSSTMITDTSSSSPPCQQALNNSARISAIRELIETEQRYVNDLRTVANEFIKPLSNIRILNDYEIEQLFSNWFDLIACNAVLLSTFQEQVQYKEYMLTPDIDARTLRSVSMTNIAKVAQAPIKHVDDVADSHHNPFSYQRSHSPSFSRLKYRTGVRRRRRSPSPNSLLIKRPLSIERLNDNIVPQSSLISSSMTINESTRIGEALCSYLPYMADAYFEYCNGRSQANKYLQSKMDSNNDFSSSLKTFQNNTRGLSLNGFLTKPIQRVTRYPLLIEKILKHTPVDHPDYESIQQALERAIQLNERINKQICEQENSSRLEWLQQHIIFGTDEYSADGYVFDELLKFNSPTKFHTQRQLLLHGLLVKISSGKELAAFLFNDFLLLTTVKSSSSNWQSQLFDSTSHLKLKLYRSPFFLKDIISATEALHDKLTFSITAKSQQKTLVVKTQLDNIRTLWVRTINSAMEECQTLEKSITDEKALFYITNNRYIPVARLNLLVQEAYISISSLTPNSRHRAVNPYCEIMVNALTLKTPFIKRTNNPKWNEPMEFLIFNLAEDLIHINVFDHEYFSPNENIGYISVQLTDILPCSLDIFRTQPSHTFIQTIYLNNGASIVIKFTVELLSPYQ